MTKLKIAKNIPIPRLRGRGPALGKPMYRLDELEVGDSVLVTDSNGNALQTYMVNWARKLDRKFSLRTLDDGNIRVWRIK